MWEGRTEGTREGGGEASEQWVLRAQAVRLDRAQREGDLTRACLKRRSFVRRLHALTRAAGSSSQPDSPFFSSSQLFLLFLYGCSTDRPLDRSGRIAADATQFVV